MTILVAYLSYSGNTKEVAEIIADTLGEKGHSVHLHEIGIDRLEYVHQYDYFFVGTFTWDYGQTPEEVKDFVLELGYKPKNVAIFGTGDTQFGVEKDYCRAVDKLAFFYNSRWPGLKIEQSPRGFQEDIVKNWTKGVVAHVRDFAYSS